MLKSFFSLILILLIFASSLGATIYRLKDPEFFGQQVRSVNLYGRLTSSLPNLISDDMVKDSGLAKEDYVDILTAAIDSQTFYGFVDQVASSYLVWLTGQKERLEFRYDLAAVKVGARQKAIDRMLTKYNALPVCDAKQVKTWSTASGLPNCQLPSGNVRTNDVIRLLGEEIDKVLEPLPNEIVGQENAGLVDLRAKVLILLRGIGLIWAATVTLLLLFLLVLRRNAFLSLAFIFLLTGLIEAAFGLIAWDWVGKLVIDSLPSQISAVVPVAVDLVAAILDVLKRSLSTASIVLLGTGAFFLLLWIFWRPKPKHSTVTTK